MSKYTLKIKDKDQYQREIQELIDMFSNTETIETITLSKEDLLIILKDYLKDDGAEND